MFCCLGTPCWLLFKPDRVSALPTRNVKPGHPPCPKSSAALNPSTSSMVIAESGVARLFDIGASRASGDDAREAERRRSWSFFTSPRKFKMPKSAVAHKANSCPGTFRSSWNPKRMLPRASRHRARSLHRAPLPPPLQDGGRQEQAHVQGQEGRQEESPRRVP